MAAARSSPACSRSSRDNLPGTLDDIDSEFLHDLRVAVRRTRRCSASSGASTRDRLQHFRDEFKRLQAITGDLRDLDVYLLDFDDLRASLPDDAAPTSSRCAACSSTAAPRRSPPRAAR